METNATQLWAELDEARCPCQGEGWAEIDTDTYRECPIHFVGQLHPQTRVLLLDEPARLAEEERRSQIRYRLDEAKKLVDGLQIQLRVAQKQVVELELELINKTPTKKMPAINPNDPHLDIDEVDWSDVT